ncbi:L-histidine N(alpha)-methyltransferase [Pseudalkalibacillus sp. Hm43]|uniref:L-histidine N(alpha)-methyltransferase n=1 Tax=Pseudalkalibacillus sp. Hm43 TaxID=3450742 RepID=UPI003F43DA10
MKNVEVLDFQPKLMDFKEEIVMGLRKDPKQTDPKLLYDEAGSQLFEQITVLPEYYPTRTELKIMKEYSCLISEMIGKDTSILEFGSGSHTKISLLLENLQEPAAYIPVDISKSILEESVNHLSHRFPKLMIKGICTDYTKPFQLPIEVRKAKKRVVFFPGSTYGNFEPLVGQNFLKRTSKLLQKGDGLLIGVDTKKELPILEDAYNDSQNVTAEFNLNLLKRINREHSADFKLDTFRHHAFYNEEIGRIEMHLISTVDQKVSIDEDIFHFREGESIHTENSYKYEPEEFKKITEQCGFKREAVWLDEKGHFSIHYFTVK